MDSISEPQAGESRKVYHLMSMLEWSLSGIQVLIMRWWLIDFGGVHQLII